jgi:hypothetical protein
LNEAAVNSPEVSSCFAGMGRCCEILRLNSAGFNSLIDHKKPTVLVGWAITEAGDLVSIQKKKHQLCLCNLSTPVLLAN